MDVYTRMLYDLMLVERLWVLSNSPGGGDCVDLNGGQRGG